MSTASFFRSFVVLFLACSAWAEEPRVSALDQEVEFSPTEKDIAHLATKLRLARVADATKMAREDAEAAAQALAKSLRKDLKTEKVPADAPMQWRASSKLIEFFFFVSKQGEPATVTVHAVRFYLSLARDEEEHLLAYVTRHARLTLPLAPVAQLFDELQKSDPTWAGAATNKANLFQAEKLGKEATALVKPWLAAVVGELKESGVNGKSRFEARIQGKALVLLLFTNGATEKIPTVELTLAPVREGGQEKGAVQWFLFRATTYPAR